MGNQAFKRSLLNRIAGGVGGGIGDYLGISAWWVRAALLSVAVTNLPFGALLYVLLWFIIPGQTINEMPPVPLPDEQPAPQRTRPEGVLTIGAVAITVGLIILAETTGVLRSAGGDLMPPGMLLAIGVVLLLKHLRGVA